MTSEVSVCIPVFNNQDYIVQTIESVLNQTVKPLEIIVYNDGSTDKSVEVASKYPVRIIDCKENKGIGFARKKLVEEAKGKYICYISSDDIMLPNFIEEMVVAAKKHPNSIIYCDYNAIDGNGNIIREVRTIDCDNYDDFVMLILQQAKQDSMPVCYNIFAPTKLMKENNFDESIRYGEDLEHLLRCTLLKKVKFFYVKKVLFNYRVHQGMTTTAKREEIHKNNLKIFEKINEMLDGEIL